MEVVKSETMEVVKSEEGLSPPRSNNDDEDEWKCCLLVDAIDEKGKLRKIDLIERLKPNKKVQFILQKHHGFPEKSWFRFDPSFDGMEGREPLIKMITESANDCGYTLVVAKNEMVNSNNRRWLMRFVCDRNRTYRQRSELEINMTDDEDPGTAEGTQTEPGGEKKNNSGRRTTTKAICKSECCSFCLNVFLEKEGDGWFLSVCPATFETERIGVHSGHKKIPKTLIKASVRRLDNKVRKLVHCCQEAGLSATESARLIRTATSVNLDPKQIEYLKAKGGRGA